MWRFSFEGRQHSVSGISTKLWYLNQGMNNLAICFKLSEIQAKFVVCDSETEEEVKKALKEVKSVGLFSIGRVDDCDDLIALAHEAAEGINDRSVFILPFCFGLISTLCHSSCYR